MKAIVCHAFGPPGALRLEDVPNPVPGPGTVKIAVAAAGLNFPDVLIVQGKYQVKPPFPFSPGAEVSGTVMELGEGVTSFAVGDRVMAVCTTGGFAEEALAHEASTFALPADMSFETAAVFPLVYGTTYHALVDRGQLKAGETLLVTGAGGGVGLAAVQLGAALGARVIAAASSRQKLDAAIASGATETIDYTTEKLVDRVKALTGDAGVDVVYDAVGGDVFDAALRAIAWGGRLLIVGFAAGRIPEIPANRLLLRSASAVGVYWGSFATRQPAENRANFDALFALATAGKIAPHIGARYALADAAQAIVDMGDRKILGKAVVTIGG